MLKEVLTVSALIAVVLLVRAIFKNRVPKRMLYALWLAVLLKLCLPGTLFSLPLLPAEDAAAPTQDAALPAQTVPVIQQPVQSTTQPQAPAQQPVSPAQEAVKPVAKPLTTTQSLQIVWAGGSALLGLWLFGAWMVFTIRLHRDRRFLGKRGGTRIYASGAVKSPCLAGLIPAVYLTEDVLQADEAELILHHELTHLRHLDFLWSFCRTAAVIAYWWNPFIWLAAICSKRDAELACDEAVAAKLPEKERLAYARAILAQAPRKASALSLAGPPVKERILFLTKKQRTSVLCIILALLLVASATGCSFAELTRKKSEEITRPEEAAEAANASIEQNTVQPESEPESTSLEERLPIDEAARAAWSDFADTWRLDYLPDFSRGAAPASTSEYLMWVFTRNMDALKEQGYMTKSYVETEIRAHFEVEDLTHEGLTRTWNFDGEAYTAVPGGVKDRPLARLDSVTTAEENGQLVYYVQYTLVQPDYLVLSDQEWKALAEQIAHGDTADLQELGSYTVCFSYENGEPVFLSHTEVVQEGSFLRDAALRAKFTADASQVADSELLGFLRSTELAARTAGTYQSGLEFRAPESLPSAQQLFMLFLTWTSDAALESCKNPEDRLYYFPRSVICRTLDCYLKEYVFHIAQCDGYDERSGMVVLPVLPNLGGELDMQMYGKRLDGGIMTCGVDFYSDERDGTPAARPYDRTEYMLQCYDGGFYILRAEGRSIPNPEEEIGGIHPWDAWDLLPQSVTEGFVELGIVGVSREDYNVVKYGRDGLYVHVLRLQEGKEDTWQGLDGSVSCVYTTSPDYPTPRGLRVGDPEASAAETIGALWGSFEYELQDGVVSRMGFFSYYDEGGPGEAFTIRPADYQPGN